MSKFEKKILNARLPCASLGLYIVYMIVTSDSFVDESRIWNLKAPSRYNELNYTKACKHRYYTPMLSLDSQLCKFTSYISCR